MLSYRFWSITLPYLKIRTPEGKEKKVVLDLPSLTIGKDDPLQGVTNQISLDDPTVSRRHARIFREGDTWFIEDLGSKNFTYLNGKKIQRAPLKPGDTIQIGQHRLILEGEGTPSPPIFPWEREVLPVEKPSPDTTLDIQYLYIERLSSLVLHTFTLGDFLERAMDLVLEALRAKRGILFTMGEQGEPVPALSRGTVVYERRLIQEAVRRKEVLLDPEDPSRPRSTPVPSPGHALPSLLVAPLVSEGSCRGVIYLESEGAHERFHEKDRIILLTLAQQIAAGIERVQLYEKIREEARIRTQLERFFSPQVVEHILKEIRGKGDLGLKPQRVEGTFLFADIQGFSLLAERLPPGEIAELLRRYFSHMTEVIFSYQGTVDKYIGDCILAVFGVPFPYEDHALKAVQCALEMCRRHRRFIAELEESRRFHIRIGVNTGEAVAGYMGSPQRLEYTVLGEAVIVANRLQNLAEPDQIYLGKSTWEKVKEQIPVLPIGVATLKGGKRIEVFKVQEELVF